MERKYHDAEHAVYITVDDAAKMTSLGVSTIRKCAKECGAARKIGKCYRIDREMLLDYLDSLGA